MLCDKTKRYLYIIFTASFLMVLSAILIVVREDTLKWYLKMAKDELLINQNEIFIGISDSQLTSNLDTTQSFTHFIFKKLTEIAYDSGFYSSQHFSSTFSKWVEIAPKDYRQKKLNGKNDSWL